MKRLILFLLFAIYFLQFTNAGSIGISPAHFEEDFEPGLERDFQFLIQNYNSDRAMTIYVDGDLANYTSLDKEFIVGKEYVTLHMKLPKSIQVPGTHHIYIGAKEYINETESTVAGLAAIQARIDIKVPYPGVYIESTLKIEDVNEGEKSAYEISLENLGTEGTIVDTSIEIFSRENQSLQKIELGAIELASKEAKILSDEIDTTEYVPGEYSAIATLKYQEVNRIRETFRVGQFLVEITDYSYLFEKGKINEFIVEVENKWNGEIKEVYADVSITDEGEVKDHFTTPSISMKEWGVANLTGYIDTTEMEAKRHLASITIHYENYTTNKLVAIYVQDPESNHAAIYIAIGAGIVLAILIAIIVYLFLRLEKLKGILKKNVKIRKKK